MLKQEAIPENVHPNLELSNLEPFQLSFAYNGGTDLHLQINANNSRREVNLY